MSTVIIMGSSRSNGNTRKVSDYLIAKSNFDFIDLNAYEIAYYNYDRNYPASDEYLTLMEKVITYDQIIFATPVYWYSMSAQLKTFFDRLTDCLKMRKDIGYALKGKTMFLISCGSDNDLPEGFEIPFKNSAEYLGMQYGGSTHVWVGGEDVEDDVKILLDKFNNLLLGKNL